MLKEVRALLASPRARQELSRQARALLDGRGLERVRELVTVVERLKWDSEFFRVGIATLHTARVNADVMEYALAKCRKDSIDCLYYLCDCHDPRSVVLAEKHGFHFVDIRMTFQRDARTTRRDAPPRKTAFTIRQAREADIPQMRALADRSYVYSRYFFDQRFPDDLCGKFYANWIEKSCRGYADVVIVAASGSKVLGYISVKMQSPSRASIGLVGVAPDAAGAGVGKRLVHESLRWAERRNAASMEVVTQGRNYLAQRLYQSCGFKTLKLELWYHKWFNRD